METICESCPLLDDVSSELDQERTAILFKRIEQIDAQVFISTTGNTHLPHLDSMQIYEVLNGTLQRG